MKRIFFVLFFLFSSPALSVTQEDVNKAQDVILAMGSVARDRPLLETETILIGEIKAAIEAWNESQPPPPPLPFDLTPELQATLESITP